MSSSLLKPFSRKQFFSKSIPPVVAKPEAFLKDQVNVEFIEGLSLKEIVTKVCELPSPQVIIWYIGYRGLRKSCVDFYKEYLVSPVITQNNEAILWLYDLTAWGSFNNLHCSPHNFSKCCETIENFSHKNIKCIKSSDIFNKIQNISNKEMVDYFRNALNRNFISKSSESFPNNNIRIKDIFPSNSPIVSYWSDHDANKTYSIFQYLEGCLLVDEIVMKQTSVSETHDIQIVFVLPNDEIKYYKDKENSFKSDVAFLLSKRDEMLKANNIHLDIKFFAFKYGSSTLERPYNAPGKPIKNGKLSFQDVCSMNI